MNRLICQILIFILFFVSALASSCMKNSRNSVGVTMDNDIALMWYILTWMSPIGKCECEDGTGKSNGMTRYFWKPITSNETTQLDYASNHSK